jgi:hypothetical protein
MKNHKNNVLPFPKPPEDEPGISTISPRSEGNASRFICGLRICRRLPQRCCCRNEGQEGNFQDCEVPGKRHADGNEIPSAPYPRGTRLPVRRLASLPVGRMEQTSNVLHGRAAATQVGAVGNHGIDHQRARRIVRAELEADRVRSAASISRIQKDSRRRKGKFSVAEAGTHAAAQTAPGHNLSPFGGIPSHGGGVGP